MIIKVTNLRPFKESLVSAPLHFEEKFFAAIGVRRVLGELQYLRKIAVRELLTEGKSEAEKYLKYI